MMSVTFWIAEPILVIVSPGLTDKLGASVGRACWMLRSTRESLWRPWTIAAPSWALRPQPRRYRALLAGTCGFDRGVSARMFVWNAMPSIMPMISAILCELCSISAIVPTTFVTIAAP